MSPWRWCTSERRFWALWHPDLDGSPILGVAKELRAKAQPNLGRCRQQWPVVPFSYLEALSWSLLPSSQVLGSTGEIPSSGPRSGRKWWPRRSSFESSPWRAGIMMFAWFPLVIGLVDVRAATPDCRCLCAKPATSGTMVSSGSTRKGNFSTWLQWQFYLACATELSAWSTRPRGGDLALLRGGGPR